MPVTISSSVGWKARNSPDDVRKIHDLLKHVPASKGGPPSTFDALRPYSPDTDRAIYNFQLFHFGKARADALVEPGRGTLAKLNELQEVPGVTPPPAPAPTPNPPTFANPEKVIAVLGNRPVGFGKVTGYDPGGEAKGVYKVPLYELHLSPARAENGRWHPEGQVYTYKVIRFGVNISKAPVLTIAGLYNAHDYVLNWVAYLKGSWQITGNFLIHQGAEDPNTPWGANGCVEVTGLNGWSDFKSRVLQLSFGPGYATVKSPEAKISKAKSFVCRVEQAATPPVSEEKQEEPEWARWATGGN